MRPPNGHVNSEWRQDQHHQQGGLSITPRGMPDGDSQSWGPQVQNKEPDISPDYQQSDNAGWSWHQRDRKTDSGIPQWDLADYDDQPRKQPDLSEKPFRSSSHQHWDNTQSWGPYSQTDKFGISSQSIQDYLDPPWGRHHNDHEQPPSPNGQRQTAAGAPLDLRGDDHARQWSERDERDNAGIESHEREDYADQPWSQHFLPAEAAVSPWLHQDGHDERMGWHGQRETNPIPTLDQYNEDAHFLDKRRRLEELPTPGYYEPVDWNGQSEVIGISPPYHQDDHDLLWDGQHRLEERHQDGDNEPGDWHEQRERVIILPADREEDQGHFWDRRRQLEEPQQDIHDRPGGWREQRKEVVILPADRQDDYGGSWDRHRQLEEPHQIGNDEPTSWHGAKEEVVMLPPDQQDDPGRLWNRHRQLEEPHQDGYDQPGALHGQRREIIILPPGRQDENGHLREEPRQDVYVEPSGWHGQRAEIAISPPDQQDDDDDLWYERRQREEAGIRGLDQQHDDQLQDRGHQRIRTAASPKSEQSPSRGKPGKGDQHEAKMPKHEVAASAASSKQQPSGKQPSHVPHLSRPRHPDRPHEKTPPHAAAASDASIKHELHSSNFSSEHDHQQDAQHDQRLGTASEKARAHKKQEHLERPMQVQEAVEKTEHEMQLRAKEQQHQEDALGRARERLEEAHEKLKVLQEPGQSPRSEAVSASSQVSPLSRVLPIQPGPQNSTQPSTTGSPNSAEYFKDLTASAQYQDQSNDSISESNLGDRKAIQMAKLEPAAVNASTDETTDEKRKILDMVDLTPAPVADRLLYIGVFSNAGDFERRKIARETWIEAVRKVYAPSTVRINFVIGRRPAKIKVRSESFPSNASLLAAASDTGTDAAVDPEEVQLDVHLADESNKHGDLYHVPYEELPVKVLVFFAHAVEEGYRFVMKVDNTHEVRVQPLMASLSKESLGKFLYAGQFLSEPSLLSMEKEASLQRYFTGPCYLASWSLARRISKLHLDHSIMLWSYNVKGTEMDDVDMGQWVAWEDMLLFHNSESLEQEEHGSFLTRFGRISGEDELHGENTHDGPAVRARVEYRVVDVCQPL